MEKLSDVEVVDRALLHGDLVRETTGAERAGLVVASQLLVDVRELAAPHGTHRAVDSCRLRHAQPFRAGTYVVKDGWLGRVEAWRDDVTVEFADGSAAKVYDPKTNRLLTAKTLVIDGPFVQNGTELIYTYTFTTQTVDADAGEATRELCAHSKDTAAECER